MLRLVNKVQIGDYILAGVVLVEIESSWEMLTDTCKISLPSEVFHAGKFVNLAESRLIKRGDRVKVKLGYDDNLLTEFEGYVAKVQTGSPTVIECADAAWLLKQKSENSSHANIRLGALVQSIVPAGITVKASDAGLGQFRISKATAAQVLEEIQKSYGYVSYFKGMTLYTGVTYQDVGPTHIFKFGYNIIEENSELVYQTSDEVRIKVKAISILPDNKKIEIELGDPDGEFRTLNFYNLTKSDLEKVANEKITQLRYDGYFGNFETFGEPSVQHGDVVKILDDKYDRAGLYYVKRVVKTFGTGGYRQKIYIDRKI